MSTEASFLYKYRCVSDLSLKMLKESKYYFARVHDFNDPLDCAVEPVYELPPIEKIIENQAKVLQYNEGISSQEALHKSQIIRDIPITELEKLLEKLRDDIQSILRNELGILSLSAKNDSILMWSHYSDYHRGFCIEFKRTLDNPLSKAMPVEYYEEYPNFNYFDDLPGKICLRMILIKAFVWSYEVEWRGIQKANTEMGYTDDMITGIIFGLRMPEDHKNKIYQILQDKKHIKFYQAELLPRKFKLAITEVNKL